MHKKVHLSSSEWLACWLSLFQCPFHQIFPSQKCSFCFVTVRTRLDFSLKLPSLQLLTSHFQLSFTFGHPGLLMFHFALVNNMQEHHDASQEYIYIYISHVFHTFSHVVHTHIFWRVLHMMHSEFDVSIWRLWVSARSLWRPWASLQSRHSKSALTWTRTEVLNRSVGTCRYL